MILFIGVKKLRIRLNHLIFQILQASNVQCTIKPKVLGFQVNVQYRMFGVPSDQWS
jgi:predicted transcriptional regulator